MISTNWKYTINFFMQSKYIWYFDGFGKLLTIWFYKLVVLSYENNFEHSCTIENDIQTMCNQIPITGRTDISAHLLPLVAYSRALTIFHLSVWVSVEQLHFWDWFLILNCTYAALSTHRNCTVQLPTAAINKATKYQIMHWDNHS